MFIWIYTSSSVFASVSAGNSSEHFVKYTFSKDKFYCNEGFFVRGWLYSISPDVAYAEELDTPSLVQGKFSYISEIRQPFVKDGGHYGIRKEKIGETEYYVYPISSYFVTLSDAGKYELDENDIRIGITFPIISHDLMNREFISGYETRKVDLTSPKTSFSVRNLPQNSEDINFSGAIGSFEVHVILPKGNIIYNEQSSIVFLIKGQGLIGEGILPEYQDAFKKGAKLKSVSENSDIYFDGENVVSILELSCEFIPTDIDNCEIGAVTFGFFDPTEGKYKNSYSKPVKIDVKSLAIERELHDI